MELNNDKLFLLYYLAKSNQKESDLEFYEFSQKVWIRQHKLLTILFDLSSEKFFECTMSFDVKGVKKIVKNTIDDYTWLKPDSSYIDQLNSTKDLLARVYRVNSTFAFTYPFNTVLKYDLRIYHN